MSTSTTLVAAPNALLLVEDVLGGDSPASMHRKLVSATASCIAIGCLSPDDGLTLVSLRPGLTPVPSLDCVFAGTLLLPSTRIAIRTVHGTIVLSDGSDHVCAHVNIFANSHTEPDAVVVCFE